MKKSDLDILLKFEDINRNALLRDLQNFNQEKAALEKRRDILNKNFLKRKPSLDDAPFLKYRAMENLNINQKILELNDHIATQEARIREQITYTKSLEILKEDIILKEKKHFQKSEESKVEEYNIFKFRTQ